MLENLNKIASELQSPSVDMGKLTQYAQGTNPLVPQFLALAEIKRRQDLTKLTPGQPSSTTVAQDLVSQAVQPQMPPQMAQAPQQAGLPGMQRPQGVAALPSGMGEQSFAGGGIVAFASGGSSFEDKLRDLQYGDEEDDGSNASSLFRPGAAREKLKKALPNIGSFKENLARYNIEDESNRGVVTPAQATYSASAPQIDAGGPTAAERAAFYEKKNKPTSSTTSSKIVSPKEVGSTEPATPKESMYDKYEKMLTEDVAARKAERSQDKYMRLLEAGLGIMGGTSPYAAANIGQGAMGAAKGYAQDQAMARKEDRESIKELMGLGLKREEAEREAEKLAMTKELYGAHGQYYKAAAAAQGARAAGVGAGTGTKLQIAQERNAVALYNKWFAANPMATPQEQSQAWANFQQMAGSSAGGPAEPTTNTVQWNTLGAPKK